MNGFTPQRLAIGLAATVAMVLPGWLPRPAEAQSVLKRLEEQIRRRVAEERGEVPPPVPADGDGADAKPPARSRPPEAEGGAEDRPEMIPLPRARRNAQAAPERAPAEGGGGALGGLFRGLLGGGQQPKPDDPPADAQPAPPAGQPRPAPAQADPPKPAADDGADPGLPFLQDPFPEPIEPKAEPAPAEPSPARPAEPPADELTRLRQRVEQLEQRIEALERALRNR